MAQVLPFTRAETERTKAAPQQRVRPLLGEVLVQAGALERAELDRALAMQRQQDAPLGHILRAGRVVSDQDLIEALSVQSGLGQVDLEASPPDQQLMLGLDPFRCLALQAVPWRQVGGMRVIAIANPAAAPAAMAELAGDADRVGLAIASTDAIRDAITGGFRGRLRDAARLRCPEALSCRGWIARLGGWRARAAGAAAVAAVAAAPLLALQLLMSWILLMNAMTMVLRLAALFARFRHGRTPVQPAAPRLSDYRKLPRVSVLVPLREEASVARRLLEALEAMDYPAALLDIKLVLEEGDNTTRRAIERASLPVNIEIVTVPADRIMTKPRAMNYALPFCTGDIIGIYDAEDRPDPGQIRAVVQALRQSAPDVACVQGYLDFHNESQNWLTRCFTIEYAVWFRILLHGVQRLGFPIPLGGTSVFFRRRVLEEIGAWDAHNVTEDADLGMRLARFGYRCEMIPSTTMEEANCRAVGWVKQRSRWLKGYAITWATHMRNPAALLRDLGWRGFLGFQILFLGGITSYLSIPLFWAITTGAMGFDLSFWKTLPAPLMWGYVVSMVLGQAVMLTVAAIALWDTGRLRMLPWVLTLPLYWPLGALAAYRAIAEIFYAPFHWHKTEHGLAEDAPAADPAEAEDAITPAPQPVLSPASSFSRVS